jgi:pyruvate formate lyase activating enzyme
MKKECTVCCHHCLLEEGKTGACGARRNEDGRIIASNYGRLTALALDPIEKKPLARFYPGRTILSVGSYGCSLRCPFCQNYEIASARESAGRGRTGPAPITYYEGRHERLLDTAFYSPRDLCDIALGLRDRGNLGIAFTYNEPLVGWEFVLDTAKLFHKEGMKTVLVSNGMASQEVLHKILPYIDAMNIDLKGFTEEFYRDFVGGDLEMVKDFIRTAAHSCHIELTKLIFRTKMTARRRCGRWQSGSSLCAAARGMRSLCMYPGIFPGINGLLPRRL